MRLVAPVQVDDHRRHPLERAGARERPGVERRPPTSLPGELDRKLLRAGDRRRRSARPRPERVRLEVRRGDRMQARRHGRRPRRPARAPPGSDASGSGSMPDSLAELDRAGDAEQRCRRRARRQGGVRSRVPHPPSPRGRPDRLRRQHCSFVAPVMPRAAELGGRLPCARSSSREPMTTSSPPSATSRAASARPKLPVPPRIATLTRAHRRSGPPTAASFRAALSSDISVLVTSCLLQAGHRTARLVGLVDHEHVDQVPRNTTRRAPASFRPRAARACGRPGL